MEYWSAGAMGAAAVALSSAGRRSNGRTRLVDALPLKPYPMEKVIQTEN
jgi:hypothetical protein